MIKVHFYEVGEGGGGGGLGGFRVGHVKNMAIGFGASKKYKGKRGH